MISFIVGSILRALRIFLVFFAVNGLYASDLPNIKTPYFMEVQLLSEKPLSFNGYKVKSFSFKSSKGNTDIVKFYSKLWNEEIRTVETPDWIYHSNFSGKFLTTVQVRNIPAKGFGSFNSASGLISISEPSTIKNATKRAKIERFYPISPDTRKLSDLNTIDMGKKSRTTVYDSPGGVSSNLHHYKLHFENKGWLEAKAGLSEKMFKTFSSSTLIMQKGYDELVVSFIPDKSGRTKIVSVLVNK